jgi:hypothetical protein
MRVRVRVLLKVLLGLHPQTKEVEWEGEVRMGRMDWEIPTTASHDAVGALPLNHDRPVVPIGLGPVLKRVLKD